jgi:flagellar protein FliS
MNPSSAASTYAQEAIETAPPIKIVRLLYQGAIRYIERAARCKADDPSSDFLSWINRADDIVVELRCHLREGHAPELVESLSQLYLFIEERLQRAANDRDPEPLQDATRVLKVLLEAWTAIELEAQ